MNILIFDGNFLLMKCVFTLVKLNRLYGDLWKLLDNNIEKYTTMNIWEEVIIVSDSRQKSWRKDILSKYKGHRVKDETIDWVFVFQTYSEWKESLKDRYVVLEKDSIEGDDWITSIIQLANKKGKSCLTISTDKDLHQLVKYRLNKQKSYINIQIADILGNEKVVIPIGWELWVDEYEKYNAKDVFALDNSQTNMNFFKGILRNWKYEEVDNYSCLFEKIVTGDKSDNIDSIYQTVTTTGKLRGIGEKTAQKMWNFYKENYDIKYNIDEQFIEDIIKCLEIVSKKDLSKQQRIAVQKNIKTNIKLIYLNYTNFPEWVLDDIIEIMTENLNI